MSIRFVCPKCERVYRLPESRIGHMATCSCGYSFIVPKKSLDSERSIRRRWALVVMLLVGGLLVLLGLAYWVTGAPLW